MKLTKENIEAWLLDLSEGKLTAAQEEQVRLFLKKHPELGLSADGLNAIPSVLPLINEENDWDSLKKTSGWPRIEKEKEEFLIGKLENTLTPEEEKELNNRLLNDDALAKEWETYRNLVLQARKNEKSGLKTFLTFSNLVVTQENYKEFFIVAAETGDEKLTQQVKNWIGLYPATQHEWEVVSQLKLSPALNERMPFKEKLKKRETKVAFIYSRRFYAGITAAAAVVVLFIGWNWFTPGEKQTEIANTPNNKNENAIKNNTADNNTSVSEENNANTTQPNLAKQLPIKNNQVVNEMRDTTVRQQQNNMVNNKDTAIQPLNNIAIIKKDTAKTPDESHKSITKEAFYKDSIPHSIKAGYIEPNVNFTTMKNVVGRVSKGYVEVDRKKDNESKEFYLRIGKMVFHRKKKLTDQ